MQKAIIGRVREKIMKKFSATSRASECSLPASFERRHRTRSQMGRGDTILPNNRFSNSKSVYDTRVSPIDLLTLAFVSLLVMRFHQTYTVIITMQRVLYNQSSSKIAIRTRDKFRKSSNNISSSSISRNAKMVNFCTIASLSSAKRTSL